MCLYDVGFFILAELHTPSRLGVRLRNRATYNLSTLVGKGNRIRVCLPTVFKATKIAYWIKLTWVPPPQALVHGPQYAALQKLEFWGGEGGGRSWLHERLFHGVQAVVAKLETDTVIFNPLGRGALFIPYIGMYVASACITLFSHVDQFQWPRNEAINIWRVFWTYQ
jgi:hypothetical protein